MADRAFERRDLHDPKPIRLLFSNTGLAPLWLVARLYLGYEWLIAGWHKVWGPDRWIAVPGPDGLPLKALWERAVGAPADGQPPMAYDWYGDVARFMLRHEWYTWFSWVIAIGEVAAGVAISVVNAWSDQNQVLAFFPILGAVIVAWAIGEVVTAHVFSSDEDADRGG